MKSSVHSLLLCFAMAGATVCAASLATLLLGKALLRLSPAGAKLFYIIAALCLLLASLALVAAGFGFSLDWLGKFLHLTLSEGQRTAVLGLKALPVFGLIGIAAVVLLARMISSTQISVVQHIALTPVRCGLQEKTPALAAQPRALFAPRLPTASFCTVKVSSPAG